MRSPFLRRGFCESILSTILPFPIPVYIIQHQTDVILNSRLTSHSEIETTHPPTDETLRLLIPWVVFHITFTVSVTNMYLLHSHTSAVPYTHPNCSAVFPYGNPSESNTTYHTVFFQPALLDHHKSCRCLRYPFLIHRSDTSQHNATLNSVINVSFPPFGPFLY